MDAGGIERLHYTTAGWRWTWTATPAWPRVLGAGYLTAVSATASRATRWPCWMAAPAPPPGAGRFAFAGRQPWRRCVVRPRTRPALPSAADQQFGCRRCSPPVQRDQPGPDGGQFSVNADHISSPGWPSVTTVVWGGHAAYRASLLRFDGSASRCRSDGLLVSARAAGRVVVQAAGAWAAALFAQVPVTHGRAWRWRVDLRPLPTRPAWLARRRLVAVAAALPCARARFGAPCRRWRLLPGRSCAAGPLGFNRPRVG
jgi:hypothetical protein